MLIAAEAEIAKSPRVSLVEQVGSNGSYVVLNSGSVDMSSGQFVEHIGHTTFTQQAPQVHSKRPEWSQAKNARFDELGLKFAFEEASEEELEELRELQALRRNEFYPRSAVDLILEFERRQALKNLANAIKSCLRAYSGPDQTPS